MAKVAVIGAGHVGATAADLIAQKGLADVELIDIAGGLATGKAIDMMQAMAVQGLPRSVAGGDDFSAIVGSDIVVITAGFPRKPGMSRDDLLARNANVVKGVIGHVKRLTPDALILMVTNPLDDMTTLALKYSGFERERVIGMGGVLDAGRFIFFICRKLSVEPGSVSAMVVGAHGDTMIPLVHLATVGGERLDSLLDADELAELIERTRKGGAEIISYLKQGSAFYAPAAAVAEMVEVILEDQKRTLAASAYLTGEYGVEDVCLGVPVVLGRHGIDRILEVELSRQERELFRRSGLAVKDAVERVVTSAPAD